MVQSQYSLSWGDYESNVCRGFSSLQQNGEFVDMTLSADGHFVKVHQVLMALASPYLKELITSAPCQHPVIYLNNVSYVTLCSLLEYVYTGEVLIPSESLAPFIQTAKNLHIRGLESFENEDKMTLNMVDITPNTLQDNQMCNVSGIKRMAMSSDMGVDLPAAARKILVTNDNTRKTPVQSKPTKEESPDYDILGDSGPQDDDVDYGTLDSSHDHVQKDSATASNLQYTVSNRGSLQVILNRYIYNLASAQRKTGARRWRCIEYRNNRCMAFLVTKGNVVLNRANLHNHSFHDKKILQKIERKAVFTAYDDVEAYKQREQAKETDMTIETSMEQDDCVSELVDDYNAKNSWSDKHT